MNNIDSRNGIGNIVYTHSGIPLAIKDGYAKTLARYSYDAAGRRLSAAVSELPYGGESFATTRHYVNGMELTRDEATGSLALDRIALPWGYIDARGAMMTCVADYQGNVRAVFCQYTGSVVQTTDYYPYGLPKATSTYPEVNRYKFGGKELNTDLGMDFADFDARLTDLTLGLFHRTDPKAGDYPGLNPFLFCAANPINFIDPTGEVIEFLPGESQQFKDKYYEARVMMKELGIDNIMTALDERSETVYITEAFHSSNSHATNNCTTGDKITIHWNPTEALYIPKGTYDNTNIITPLELLSHEGDHALQSIENPEQQVKDKNTGDNNFNNEEEKRVILGSETYNVQKLNRVGPNEPSRTNHINQQPFHTDKLIPTIEDFEDSFYNNIK